MSVRTRFVRLAEEVPEGATLRYTARLTDERNLPLSSQAMMTMTLTLYDLSGSAQTILNEVDGIDILNTGRGTLDTQGVLVVTLSPEDNPIVDDRRKRERHLMLFEWTFDGGNKTGRHEVEFVVRNLALVGEEP